MKPDRCHGPVSRRSFLTIGTLGVAGLSLGDVMRLRAAERKANAAPDTSVLFVWLAGGPPHLDMYDMKPDAPDEYRGPFRPIRTNVPGLDVCEHMPLHAKCADKYTIIRSISHTFNDHGGGSKRVMTGRIPKTPTETINDAPAVSTIVAKMREQIDVGLPNCISAVDGDKSPPNTYAQGAAYLGPRYLPFMLAGDPNKADFQIRNVSLDTSMSLRLDDRLRLQKGLDTLRRDLDSSGMMGAMDRYDQQALSLMASPQSRHAFDLSKEPASVRDRYGRHAWGQRALLGRRLVEAGCSFVTVVMENPHIQGTFYNWDTHAVNHDNFKDMSLRLPRYDQAITALIEDLHARGLTDKVMLVVTGEFGRSPKISINNDPKKGMRNGREHWPQAMSVLMCGGGMRHGQIVGSTNARGERPHTRPLTPNDMWATVYRHLGIDIEHTFPDPTGRPMVILPFGSPIRELI
jgi:hypothetical protein